MNINDLLAGHDVIGWDVDGTILDHPNAPIMHRYIRDHPEKSHYIVTFRSHGWEREIFRELAALHRDFPRRAAFDGVINLADAMYEKTERVRKTQNDPNHPVLIEMLEWKGLVCSQYGITVLIDDMTDQVIRGCDRYGVCHIHPDDLDQSRKS